MTLNIPNLVLLFNQLKKGTVKVDGWKAKRSATGRGSQNLELAKEMTDWEIVIEDASKEIKSESESG